MRSDKPTSGITPPPTEAVRPADGVLVCRCENGPTAPLWASKWNGACLICKGTVTEQADGSQEAS
jgi:predicted NUDIX family NTP pyrophosphohydrolase